MSKQVNIEIKERILYIGEIDTASCTACMKDIDAINEADIHVQRTFPNYKPDPIILNINSYGGEVFPGFGLYDKIENSNTPIHTIVSGMAMSMGLIILLAGHKRYMTKNSTIMYHENSGMAFGKAEAVKEQLTVMKEVSKMLANVVTSKTNITEEKLNKVIKSKKDWFIYANEALKLKIIEKII